MNLARSVQKRQVHLQRTRVHVRLAAPRRSARAARASRRRACRRARAAGARRAPAARGRGGTSASESFATSLPGGAEDGRVRGDEQHPLAVAVLGGQPLEQRVGVGAKRTESGPSSASSPTPSKTTTPRAPRSGDEARERVDELARVAVRPGVQEVVAVEEVERRVSHRAGGAPRTGAAAAATLTLSDSTAPASGIETSASQRPAHERPQALALGAEDERERRRRGRPPTSRRRRRRRRRRPRARRPSPRSR